MSYTHSFVGYTPPVRYDDDPWTSVRIEESTTEAGSYATIDTLALSPVDTDPSQPASRNFTTDNAANEQAWFRLVFLDAGGQLAPASDPVFSPAPNPIPWAPTVAQVAAIVADHTYRNEGTVGEANNIVANFTSETSPTASQVAPLIDQAVTETAPHVNVGPSEAVSSLATLAAARRAAMLVLFSYFSESLAEGTAYDDLRQLWLDALAGLDASQGDTGQTKKGIYSIRLVSGTYPDIAA